MFGVLWQSLTFRYSVLLLMQNLVHGMVEQAYLTINDLVTLQHRLNRFLTTSIPNTSRAVCRAGSAFSFS